MNYYQEYLKYKNKYNQIGGIIDSKVIYNILERLNLDNSVEEINAKLDEMTDNMLYKNIL